MKTEYDFQSLFEQFPKYCVSSLITKRIRYNEIIELINTISSNNLFTVKKAGRSVEGRDINCISFGNGQTKIFAWSQMHGDEPIATAVLFDILNFFADKDEFNALRNSLLSKITFYFVPMLNPDGAERHQRENAFNVDINRDALKQQAPESKILSSLAKSIKPHFAFNLHDQNSYYTTGRTGNNAVISLLAPPFDFEKSINDTRTRSMEVISVIHKTLSRFIHENIARYNDDHEPRSFGDTFTKSGISSILIESGNWKNSADKEFIRQLNFIAIISAFLSIADNSYANENIQSYNDIPENESLLFDLLIKNLTVNYNNSSYIIDIGINREKYFDESSNEFYFKGKIQEVGDLSFCRGFEEYDMSGFTVEPSRVSDLIVTSISDIETQNINSLWAEGYAFIHYNGSQLDKPYIKQPINIITPCRKYVPQIRSDELANFIICKEGKINYIIINGFFQVVNDSGNSILNSLVIP